MALPNRYITKNIRFSIECYHMPVITKTTCRCNACNKFTKDAYTCSHCGSTDIKKTKVNMESNTPTVEAISKALESVGLMAASIDMTQDFYESDCFGRKW